MNLVGFYSTTVGKKAVVAVTGMLLVGFLIAHLLGNLQIFLGAEKLNYYAQKLRGLGALLWVMRIGLLSVFVAHVFTAASLSHQNRKARPIRYSVEASVQASYASRTMVISGLTLLVYIVYHLSHFTMGWVHTQHHSHDVYAMVVGSFQNIYIAGIYVLSMVVLTFHLSHGAAVFSQTLGFATKWDVNKLKVIGRVVAAIISLGYISIPVAVQLGLVKL